MPAIRQTHPATANRLANWNKTSGAIVASRVALTELARFALNGDASKRSTFSRRRLQRFRSIFFAWISHSVCAGGVGCLRDSRGAVPATQGHFEQPDRVEQDDAHQCEEDDARKDQGRVEISGCEQHV